MCFDKSFVIIIFYYIVKILDSSTEINMINSHKEWYRLDNAAKIYPSIMSKRITTVFRLSVTLKEPVTPSLLQESLENIIPRFPYYNVTLKAGLFWHYLQANSRIPVIHEEREAPCRMINSRDENGFLFRILYYKNKISVEFSHILTDGTGGLIFLRSLITEYFSLKGINCVEKNDIIRKSSTPQVEEFEDGYRRYYKEEIPPPSQKERAFHVTGSLTEKNNYNIITGITPVENILKNAKEMGVTITEFLASIYLFSMQEYVYNMSWKMKKKLMRPIRLMVPVNLRTIYPSKTMRNFFLTVTPGIDPRLGKYSLEEIVKNVYHYMRVEVNERFINQQIKRNVRGEIHPAIRTIPLFIKIWIEKMLYNTIASSRHSGVLTNLGKITMPDPLSGQIERFEVIPNPNPETKINFSIVSYEDNLHITFGNLTDNNEVIKIFFSTLRKMNFPVKVETNLEK